MLRLLMLLGLPLGNIDQTFNVDAATVEGALPIDAERELAANSARDQVLATLQQIRGSQRVTSASPEQAYEALEKYGVDLVAIDRDDGLGGAAVRELQEDRTPIRSFAVHVGHEGDAVQVFGRGETGQLQQGGHQIDGLHGRLDDDSL